MRVAVPAVLLLLLLPLSFVHGSDYDVRVVITMPHDGETISSDTVTVEWHPEGADSQLIVFYRIRLDYGEWTKILSTGTRNYTYTLDNLQNGNHTVDVSAWGFPYIRGNYSSEMQYKLLAVDTVRFTVLLERPTVEITSPANGTILYTKNVTVTWSGHPGTYAIDHYEIRVDGGEWVNAGLNTTFLLHLENGEHTVTVRAVDVNGKFGEAAVSFAVSVSGMVRILVPENGGNYPSSFTARWTSNLSAGVDHYEIRYYKLLESPSGWINVGGNTEYELEHLEGGTGYEFDVKAVDNAGNVFYASSRFHVRQNYVKITHPSDGALLLQSTVTVRWEGSGALYYELQLDDHNPVKLSESATQYVLSNIPDGKHTVIVRMFAEDSIWLSALVSFTVDTSGPELRIIYPENGAVINRTSVRIVWNASDISGVDHYALSLDGSRWISTKQTSYTFENLTEGEHRVIISGVDTLGHVSTASCEFSVDTTPPKVLSVDIEPKLMYWKRSESRTISIELELSEPAFVEIMLCNSTAVLNRTSRIFINETGAVNFTVPANLPNGSYYLRARLIDGVGNSATVDIVSFVVRGNTTFGGSLLMIRSWLADHPFEGFLLMAGAVIFLFSRRGRWVGLLMLIGTAVYITMVPGVSI